MIKILVMILEHIARGWPGLLVDVAVFVIARVVEVTRLSTGLRWGGDRGGDMSLAALSESGGRERRRSKSADECSDEDGLRQHGKSPIWVYRQQGLMPCC